MRKLFALALLALALVGGVTTIAPLDLRPALAAGSGDGGGD